MLILFNFRYGNTYLSTPFNAEDLWLSGYFEEIKCFFRLRHGGCSPFLSLSLFYFPFIILFLSEMARCSFVWKNLLKDSHDMQPGTFLISFMLFNDLYFTSYVNVNFQLRMRMQHCEKWPWMNRNSYSEMTNNKEHKDWARYSTVHKSFASNTQLALFLVPSG